MVDRKRRKIDRILPPETLVTEQAQEFFYDIMKNSRDAIFRYNLKTETPDYISDSFETLTGYTPQEIMDHGLDLWIERIHPEDQPRFKHVLDECRKGSIQDSSTQIEYRFRHKDGRWIWISDTDSLVRDKEGKGQATIGVLRDITELKKQQQMLRASEERFKRLADASFEAIMIHQKGKVIDVNKRFIELHGYSLQELQTLNLSELIAPESREVLLEKYISGSEKSFEVVGLRKDGSRFPLEIRAKSTTVDGQSVKITISRDLTEQKILQQHLAESEELYRTVVENADEVISIINCDGTFQFHNTQGLQAIGLSREEFVGKNVSDLFPDEFADKKKQQIKQTLQTGKTLKTIEQIPLKDQQRWHEITMIPLRNTDGHSDCVLKIAKDIHEEKLLQEQLEKNEQKYKQLYVNAPVALFRTTLDGILLNCNRTCLEFFGHVADEPPENYLNKVCVTDYYDNRDRRKEFIEALQKDGSVDHFEVRLKRAGSSIFWASISATLFPEAGYIEGTLHDITVKKLLTRTERKILESLMQGLPNKQIALKMNRSVRTVEDHRANIMRKLEADNLIELTQKALNLDNHFKNS